MPRLALQLAGTVQGVGFRPFVFRLATKLGLGGFVRNESGSLSVEVEGEGQLLELFCLQIRSDRPALARIEEVVCQPIPERGERVFRILDSRRSAAQVFIAADLATCEACRRELFTPENRRYRYAFINCTQCGPRLTIATRSPYDRANTTMSGFAMCSACAHEYASPHDRRFHAQPIACPECGPQLELRDTDFQELASETPLDEFWSHIRGGAVGALKGLGGYHLVCLATSAEAVARLRRRKHRYEKPLAVMVRDLASAQRWCSLNDMEARQLVSPRRPIVLLRKRETEYDLAPEVAPNSQHLGVMLPYTPLHELLMQLADNMPLVMTSGNAHDEPIVYRDTEAADRLSGIADVFLTHNRPIQARCDDSVVRVIDRQVLPLRRSRGYAPESLRLPLECRSNILAVGGQLKSTFALGRERHAFLSQHLGDLHHLAAYQAFVRDIALYQDLFEVEPVCIACDSHPDYASTDYAVQRARQENLVLQPIQHHHAHLASCMADNGLDGQVIGVVFDGAGWGEDGTLWGGEFLTGGYGSFRRWGHLRPIPQPGGEAAVYEIWRMADAYASDAGCCTRNLFPQVPEQSRQFVERLIERRVSSPLTSSVGRLFDAVAALLGLRDAVNYEGQAAEQLESLASKHAWRSDAFPYSLSDLSAPPWTVDLRSMIADILAQRPDQQDICLTASRFHHTLSAVACKVCLRIRAATGLNRVVLSGGVFANAILSTQLSEQLSDEEFEVFCHRNVPPGDGGLCLGQLVVAAERLAATAR